MKNIAIYVEGGGNTVQQRAELRMGFDRLLKPQKDAAGKRRLSLKIVFCGSRNRTYEAFISSFRQAANDTLAVLLVDAEKPLPPELLGNELQNAQARCDHLARCDSWDLNDIPPEQIHLMVQCMEAWIVADPDALSAFYGKNFHRNVLPNRLHLEEEPKADLATKLTDATRGCQKGKYEKIKHASKLLAIIDTTKVAQRCPRFKTFTAWLTEQIEAC